MRPTGVKATDMTGTRLEELQGMASDHFFMQDYPFDKWVGKLNIYTRAEGVWVWSADGTKYLDMMGGLWYKAAGYGRAEIKAAVNRQMGMIESPPAWGAVESQVVLAAKIAGLHQHKDARIFLTSSGSESVETAIKIARLYQHATGKPNAYKVVARRSSYHGSTGMAVSLGQPAAADTTGVEMPGAINVTNWNSYRRPFEGTATEVALKCADQIEEAIVKADPALVAAIIAEPVSVSAGIQVPPPEYWRRLRAIADQYDVVLIADEVITGFGRTGEWFATMHWDVKPDITVAAKSLTSGYAPLGAVIMSSKIGQTFHGGAERQFRHILTFGGHPVACAAALANLEIFERENLVDNARQMGVYLSQKLENLKARYSIVGDVRGLGLLQVIELVRDRATKQSFAPTARLTEIVTEALAANRLISFRAGNLIPICPPLVISRDEVDQLAERLDSALSVLQTKLN